MMAGFVSSFGVGVVSVHPHNKSKVGSTRRRTQRCATRMMASRWFKASAEEEIEAPKDYVYAQYADLEQMPQWAPWLESVKIEDEEKGVSRWKIGSRGFHFSWRARNTKVVPGEIISWESIDGLRNKGEVTFKTGAEASSTTLRISIAFKLPGWLAPLFDNQYVFQYVTAKLHSELKTFRSLLVSKRAAEIGGKRFQPGEKLFLSARMPTEETLTPAH